MINKKTVTLFDGPIEKVFLYLPMVFLAMAPIEIFVFGAQWNRFDEFWRAILTDAIFFNVTHIALTYLMLLKIPEMKEWIHERSGGKPSRFWYKNLVLLILFIGLVVGSQKYLEGSIILGVISFALSVVPSHYAVFQMKGLSLSYNQELAKQHYKSAGEHKQKALSEWLEKYGFYSFWGSLFGLKFFTYMAEEKYLSSVLLNIMYTVCWSVLILSGIVIVLALFKLPAAFKSNKPIFLVRLLSVPLSRLSISGASALNIFHGVEYVCVVNKINQKSKQPDHYRKSFLKLAIVLLLLYSVFYVFRVSHRGEKVTPGWLAVLNAIHIGTTYLHYYLDRTIFRMRDPITKRHISPLLV